MSGLLPVATPREARRTVRGLLAAQRGLATGTAVVLVLATAVGLLTPALLGALVDAALRRDGGRIDVIAGGLVAAAAATAALTGIATALVGRLGERLLADLRESVVERALTLPLEQVEAADTGDLLARVGPDVDAISEAFRQAVPTLLLSGLAVALTGVGLLALSPWFVLGAAAAVPAQIVAVRSYLRRSRPLFAAERIAVSRRTQRLHDALTGARDLRARLAEREARAAVDGASSDTAQRSIAASRAGADFGAKLNGAEMLALGGVLVVGFLLVRSDAATVGAATAAALYIHRLFGPVMQLLGLIDTLQDATASLVRLVGIAQLPAPPQVDAPAPEGHDLALDGVRAAYEQGPDVLHGVTLSVAPGEHVAIVGPSGAGKTTLARIAAGLQRPTAGRIALGGRTPDELGAAGWRRDIALLTQETHVFAGTLADDLRLARSDAGPDELRAALAHVGAATWAHALPDGLETVVGEGGHRLTPLQAQQLALARLVLADPRIVLLDEATAEAGSVGAAQLEASARAATEGRSAVIIAHRLSHAADADRIIVLRDGRIAEDGTHDELLAARGQYATLWDAWSAGRQSGMPPRP